MLHVIRTRHMLCHPHALINLSTPHKSRDKTDVCSLNTKVWFKKNGQAAIEIINISEGFLWAVFHCRATRLEAYLDLLVGLSKPVSQWTVRVPWSRTWWWWSPLRATHLMGHVFGHVSDVPPFMSRGLQLITHIHCTTVYFTWSVLLAEQLKSLNYN